jgi:TRAP-type C4-dicarboxylate transport system permease small subunit
MENSSKIIAILFIGFISMVFLLALNLYKVRRLKKENKTLKENLDK